MKARFSFFSSTIGTKQLVGLTGLALAGFVFTHMAGNMLILVGPKPYNLYSHALISNPLIYLAEAGLVIFFLYHAIRGLYLSVRNWGARPQKYAKAPSGPKGTNMVKRTLWAQGLLILIFTIIHIATFKYGTYYETEYDGVVVRDLHRLVIEVFHSPGYVGWYILCLILLGFHLSHGFSSAFQTLGLRHSKYTPKIKILGWIYAFVVTAGFISQPLYVFLFHKG